MKTADECRDAIAKENGYDDWEDFLLKVILILGQFPKAPSPKLIVKNKLMQYEKQAMELYASQKEIIFPDESFYNTLEPYKKFPNEDYYVGYKNGMPEGAKEMRNEIIKLNTK